MKIMIAMFGHETNTFSPLRIEFGTFAPDGWHKAEQLIGQFTGTNTYLGGAIQAAQEEGVELIPIDSVPISGGPMMSDECLEYVLSHLCDQLAAHKDEADGLYLALHGGGRTAAQEDLEGYTLKRVREVIGDLPMMSSLDLHCNITPEMMALSDGLMTLKENPHIDCGATAYRVVKTLIGKLRGDIQPVTSMCHIPMMVASSNSGTFYDPMKGIMTHLKQYGEKRGFIDVSLGHGFSANDTPWAGMTVLITAEKDAAEDCKVLANYIWSRRFELTPKPLGAAEAIDKALAGVKDGYAVINESPDNPGSGCPGDSTHLLRALIEKDVPRSIFSFLVDPETAQQANKAGVGAKIAVRLGGKSAPICGEPVEVEVEVISVSNGQCRYLTPVFQNVWMDMGLCCRLRHSNVEIVVCSRREQTLDDRGLFVTGADINEYQLVCLKSANHFRGWFQERADAIVTAETPGLRPSDLSLQPFRYVMRPIFPLDRDMEFIAE